MGGMRTGDAIKHVDRGERDVFTLGQGMSAVAGNGGMWMRESVVTSFDILILPIHEHADGFYICFTALSKSDFPRTYNPKIYGLLKAHLKG